MNIDTAIRETENKLALLKAAKAAMGNGLAGPEMVKRGSGVKLSKQEENAIRNLRKAGRTLAAIAAETGRHESTIWNVLHR
jgi:hypothetical protein